MTEKNFDEDVKNLRDFCHQWDADTLTKAHPVVRLVESCAAVVVRKHDCVSDRDDIVVETLMSLKRESNYNGEGSLKGYVMKILDRKASRVAGPLVRMPRKPKKAEEKPGDACNTPKKAEEKSADAHIYPKYVPIDDHTRETPVMELVDERSEKLVDKVLRHLAYDELMQDKIAAMPELTRVIVAIVIEHEEALGKRRIAQEATRRLGRNITRHQVITALSQLAVVVGASLWRV
jgi:hypothetical protein